MPGTPACISVEDNKVDRIILHKTRLPTSLGFRDRHRLLPHQSYPINIMPALSYYTNPYLLSCPQLCEGIACPMKKCFSDAELRSLFLEHVAASHGESCATYTDGSKSPEGVGLAVVIQDNVTNKKLPSSASIFTAELRAILTAVMLSIRYEDHNFIIFSDSKSALQSVCDSFSRNPIVTEIHRWISMVQSLSKNITFAGSPAILVCVGMRRLTELRDRLQLPMPTYPIWHHLIETTIRSI